MVELTPTNNFYSFLGTGICPFIYLLLCHSLLPHLFIAAFLTQFLSVNYYRVAKIRNAARSVTSRYVSFA